MGWFYFGLPSSFCPIQQHCKSCQLLQKYRLLFLLRNGLNSWQDAIPVVCLSTVTDAMSISTVLYITFEILYLVIFYRSIKKLLAN